VVPAKFTQGAVTVAVSAGSAALGAAIRDAMRAAFDLKWALLAEVMVKLRPAVIATPGLGAAKRRQVFHDLASEEAREIAAGGGLAALVQWARRRHPELSAMKDIE
jgi:siroheme synthase (precorrin-2 oxidase/ferrochelatase)